jgi:hypothetical protein
MCLDLSKEKSKDTQVYFRQKVTKSVMKLISHGSIVTCSKNEMSTTFERNILQYIRPLPAKATTHPGRFRMD